MKKTHIISLLSLLALFAVITIIKMRSTGEDSSLNASGKTSAEKERIVKFWEIYREATALRIDGKVEEAAAAYRQALGLDDKHEDALYYLGSLCLELGEFETAEKNWKRLIEVNPHSARAHARLGDLYICLEKEEYFNLAAAEAEFKRAQEINKEESGLPLRLGEVALMAGDLAEAKYYFDTVLGIHPKSAEAHFLTGYLAWQQGESRGASLLFAKAVEHARVAPKPAHGVMGEGDTQTGRVLRAVNALRCQNPFQIFFAGLAELQEAQFTPEMQARYANLREALAQIQVRIKA
ncbi:MAG: tetratricopeptide repeat protein [candidate division KSB1 bacterium]